MDSTPHVRFIEPESRGILTRRMYRKTPYGSSNLSRGLSTENANETTDTSFTNRKPSKMTRRLQRYNPAAQHNNEKVDKRKKPYIMGLTLCSAIVLIIVASIALIFIILWYLMKKRSLGQTCKGGSCEDGLICDRGICRSTLDGQCRTMDDCASGLMCDDGVCKMALNGSCRNNEQCADLLTCTNGKCLGINGSTCKADNDCIDPYYCIGCADTVAGGDCINNICSLKQCATNGDCSGTEQCRTGYCANNVGEKCMVQNQCQTGTNNPSILCGEGGTCGYIGGITCISGENNTCASGECVTSGNSKMGVCSCGEGVGCISGGCVGNKCV